MRLSTLRKDYVGRVRGIEEGIGRGRPSGARAWGFQGISGASVSVALIGASGGLLRGLI